MWNQDYDVEDFIEGGFPASNLRSNANKDDDDHIRILLGDNDAPWMSLEQPRIVSKQISTPVSRPISSQSFIMGSNDLISIVDDCSTRFIDKEIYSSFSAPLKYNKDTEYDRPSTIPKREEADIGACSGEIYDSSLPHRRLLHISTFGPPVGEEGKYKDFNLRQTESPSSPNQPKPGSVSAGLGASNLMKRERRRERNRQSAVRCRQRFKALAFELEQKKYQLIQQEKSLLSELQHLELENRLLREQVDHLMSLTQNLASASSERLALFPKPETKLKVVIDQSTGVYYITS